MLRTYELIHHDIFSHTQMRYECGVYFLVDNDDAMLFGIGRIANLNTLTTYGDLPFRSTVGTRENLHQGAFSSTIGTYKCMNFTGFYLKVHSGERLHTGEAFGDLCHR